MSANIEYLKTLSNDPVCFIQHNKHLNDKDIQLIDDINNNKYIIIQTNQQSEKNLFHLLNHWFLWTIMMKRDTTFYMSSTLVKSKEAIQQILLEHQKSYNSLTVNKLLCRQSKQIEFEHGGKFVIAPASIDAGRGYYVDNLIIDSIHQIDDIKELLYCMLPCVTNTGKTILVLGDDPKIKSYPSFISSNVILKY